MSCFSCKDNDKNKSMVVNKTSLKDIMLSQSVEEVKNNVLQNTKKNMNNKISLIEDLESRDIPIPFSNEASLKINNEIIKRLK